MGVNSFRDLCRSYHGHQEVKLQEAEQAAAEVREEGMQLLNLTQG